MSVAPAAPGRDAWAATADRSRQSRGLAVAAAWLIGLGIVLLVREVCGWSWTEAWPLFVILIGVEGLLAMLFGLRHRPTTAWSIAWASGWLLVGIALLATTTGTIAVGTAELVATWWPVVVIAAGAWLLIAAFLPGASAAVEQVAIPLPPGASDARVLLRHGAGTLTVEAGQPGMLVVGDCVGGVSVRTTSPNSVELRPANENAWPLWMDRSLDWKIGLAPGYPVSLRIDAGASRSTIDLGSLVVPYLELHAGANDTQINLPMVGLTRVRIEAGAARISVLVPPTTAATIRTTGALVSTNIDTARFRPTVNGYETVDVATNPNRAEIELQGAISTLRVS